MRALRVWLGTSGTRGRGVRREGEWLSDGGRDRHLSLLPDGRRRRADHAIGGGTGGPRCEVPAQEMGMGTATTQTQVAATRLGLPMEGVALRAMAIGLPAGVFAGGCAADRGDRRRRDRCAAGAGRASCSSSPGTTRRLPASAWTRSAARDGGLRQARRARASRELRVDPRPCAAGRR